MIDGESRNREYKRQLSRDEKFERSVVAFLNSRDGGMIFIGVEDDGSVCGFPKPDLVQRQIADWIRNNVRPATMGLFDIGVEPREGKQVIRIVVPSGPDRPYYLKSAGMTPKGCFVRVGSQTQQIRESDIEAMFSRRMRTSLRTIPAPRQNLHFEQLHIRYQEHGKCLNDRFAETLDLLTEDGRWNLVAFLLADENNVSVKVAKYAGNDKIDLVENEEYGFCSILRACDRVLEKLTVENTTSTKIGRIYREERKRYDPAAVREAVINAFVHNDWSELDTPVFEIFSDRLEVTSYGSLLPGMTREDLLSGCSRVRNRELMRVFRDVELVEQLGSGMRRMLEAYPPDIFRYTENFFHVVFRFRPEKNPTDVSKSESWSESRSESMEVSSTTGESRERPENWPSGWPWQGDKAESWSESWSESFPPTLENKLLILLLPSPKGTNALLPLLRLKVLSNSLRLAMSSLLSAGLIERTIPDKPPSRLQKYRLTDKGRAMLFSKTTSNSSKETK